MALRTLRTTVILTLFAVAASSPALAGQPDAEGCKDHPLFNRLPGYVISRCEAKDFETLQVYVKGNQVPVEGKYHFALYSLDSDGKEASRAQLLRNYENAITKIGGKVVTSDYDGASYLQLVKDGRELWVHVNAYITSQYSIAVVEKAAMTQDVVADAKAWAGDIRTTGHVALYGILFDTNKTEIKLESAATIAEVAKLLKTEAALKLYVVGHTDAVGQLEANVKLSQGRAEAVVKELVTKHGIAATRLKGQGVGPLAPVASNDAEDGRAKNRRVELVKQ